MELNRREFLSLGLATLAGFTLEPLAATSQKVEAVLANKSNEAPSTVWRDIFAKTVGGCELDPEQMTYYHSDILAQLAARNIVIDRDQFVLYVDRSPEIQLMHLVCLEAEKNNIQAIGTVPVSTGKEFLTPLGVFTQPLNQIGWRAQGTKNKKGIRGFGVKGRRIWDFGWQATEHVYGSKTEPRHIRFCLHATDPDFLEQKLGQPASHGCIRIAGNMNEFIDRYGVLDYDYEQHSLVDPAVRWLLRPDRVVHDKQGKYLVVGDSTGQI